MRSRLQDTAPFRLPQNLLATFLLSLWLTGRSPSGSLDASASSMEFTSSALGEVDCVQATHIPSKQSIMGLKQALPAGTENSVMSAKPEAIRAIGVEIALYYVLGRLADLAFARAVLALAGALGDAFMIWQTAFSDTATSSDLRAARTLRYP